MTPKYIFGMHDPGGEYLFADKPGWIVFTEAIGCDPGDKSGSDYRKWSDAGIGVLVRVNNGYGNAGTLPKPDKYGDFAQRFANFVVASRGASTWIVGNEPNHSQERPDGEAITPAMYIDCFKQVYDSVREDAGTRHGLIPAPVAPWNVETGDWLEYQEAIWQGVWRLSAGVAIHTYSHGASPSLITSEEKMQPPYQDRYYQFRAYRDFMSRVPAQMRGLPVYVTETDQNDPWADVNSGWVQEAYAEIDRWNQTDGAQKIHCLCLYRWPKYDRWGIVDKPNVQADLRAAVAKSYMTPQTTVQTYTSDSNTVFIPSISTGGDNSTPVLPPRQITDDFKKRVPTINLIADDFYLPYYRLIKAEYVPDGAKRFGPDHHILVEVLDENGKREMGVPVHFWWGSGVVNKPTDKADGPYAVDYDMSNPGYSFGCQVGLDRALSDGAFGMGLGTIEQPDWKIHVTYYLVFQKVLPRAAQQPTQPAQPQQPAQVPPLIHPIPDPSKRVISQPFGAKDEDYSAFNLAGHNGIDFAVPEGTPVVAVDDGIAVEVMEDASGYGKYAKLIHPWGESLYAHLSRQDVAQGAPVPKGVQVGLSGNTGNSTGAHLHFGLRVNPYVRGYPYDGYIDPAPYLPTTIINAGPFIPSQPQPAQDSHAPARDTYLKWFKQYGTQFGIEWNLLAALAYAENKYQTQPASQAGALGLMQFLPSTWADMRTQLGVSDPLDPEQSIKAAAYYLVQIRSYLLRFGKMGTPWVLASYNWGIGNASNAASWDQVPSETQAYAGEIAELSEALRRWEEPW